MNLASEIKEVIDILKYQSQVRDVELVYNVDKNVPANVEMDAKRLK